MKRTFAAWIVSTCYVLQGCGSTGAPAEDYGPLLTQLTEQVVLPEHQAFAKRAADLEGAVQALVETPDAAALQSAEAAWRSAREAFRHVGRAQIWPWLYAACLERIDASPDRRARD